MERRMGMEEEISKFNILILTLRIMTFQVFLEIKFCIPYPTQSDIKLGTGNIYTVTNLFLEGEGTKNS